ncbi:MAG: hypothetical protein IT245_07860 [Bacteroidia bacterium]|nr:hypothetical protein [Bacteroidia bacterium]
MGFKINIEKPCHEDWDKMKIGIQTRHCQSCQKNVVDFTQMNRHQIIEYLLLNSSSQICARMNYSQIDYSTEEITHSLDTLLSKTSDLFQKELLISVAALLLTSCTNNNSNKELKGNISIGSIPTIELIKESNNHPLIQDIQTTEEPNKEKTVKKINPSNIDDSLVKKQNRIPEQTKEEFVEELTFKDTINFEEIVIKKRNPNDYDGVIMGGLPGSSSRQHITPPQYIEGYDSLMRFVQVNLKRPSSQGDTLKDFTIYVQFKVTARGKLRKISILNPNPSLKNYEKEAIRIIRKAKGWLPARNSKGKRISINYTLPVRF